MKKANDVGVYQLPDGFWGYRFKVVVNGKTVEKKRLTDDNGMKFKNKTVIITGGGRAVLKDGTCGSIGYGIANWQSTLRKMGRKSQQNPRRQTERLSAKSMQSIARRGVPIKHTARSENRTACGIFI